MAHSRRYVPPGPLRARLDAYGVDWIYVLVGFDHEGAPVEWLDAHAMPKAWDLRYRYCYLTDGEFVALDVLYGCPLVWADPNGRVRLMNAGPAQGGAYNDSRQPLAIDPFCWDVAGFLRPDRAEFWETLKEAGDKRRELERNKSKGKRVTAKKGDLS